MGYAEQWNSAVARKVQSAKGTPASGSGGLILPVSGGGMGRLSKGATESRLIRQDAMQRRGRHGSQRTSGSYSGEMLIGGSDDIYEALLRGTWSAADMAITQTAMTSATTTTSTIVAAAGSWITQGLRVGDVIRASGLPDAANNGRNLRITGLTASTITVAETLVANAVADTSFSITRVGRTLVNPAAGSLVKRYFTIEENDYDVSGSEVFSDCCWTRFRASMAADGEVNTEYGWTGTGAMSVNTGSAVLTSPTDVGGIPLAAVEATIRYGSTDLIDLTSFDLTVEVPSQAPSVVASKVAPDVFLGTLQVSMNLTVLRKDLLPITDFLAENQLSLHFLAGAQPPEPRAFFSAFVPNFTLGDVAKSAVSKDAGSRTVTLTVPAGMVGIDFRGGAYDPCMIRLQVSNPS